MRNALGFAVVGASGPPTLTTHDSVDDYTQQYGHIQFSFGITTSRELNDADLGKHFDETNAKRASRVRVWFSGPRVGVWSRICNYH